MTLLKTIIKACDDVKASDIEVLDMEKKSPLFDHMVLCTGRSDRQVGSIVDRIKNDLTKANFPIKNIEGKNGNLWVLVDCFDVIVHVFLNEERSKYSIEKLWGDCKRLNVEELLK
jgi:ribosome-associated protein